METRTVTTWLFRSLLLSIVLASLIVRFEGLRIRDESVPAYGVDAAIREIIEDSGFPLRENPVKPPKVLSRAIYFQRPECSRASLVLPFAISSEVLLYLDRAIKPGFEPRFFYLSKAWATYDRFAMYLEWGKYMILRSFEGRRPGAGTAIVVAEPGDCDLSVAIDWRRAWELERRRDAADARRPDFSVPRPGLATGHS